MKDSTNMAAGKVPAGLFDEGLERSALSGMLQSSFTLPEAMRTLDADCFSDPKHRDIYQAISELYEEGESIDMMIVLSRLRRMGSRVTASDLCALTIDGPVAGLMGGHFAALKELSLHRRLWQTYLRLGESIVGQTESVEQIQLTTRESLDTLFEGEGSSMTTFGEVFADLRAEIVERMNSPEGTIHGTPTEGTALVMVEKGRNIGTFRFICGFDPERTLFRPLSPGELERLRENPVEKAMQLEDAGADPFGRAGF